jgi:hypothetical protein
MVDDRPADAEQPADATRVKREGPTIELEATDVSGETRAAAPPTQPEHEPVPEGVQPIAAASASEAPPTAKPAPKPVSRPISPWVIAPFSGAVAAALVIAVGWMLGWPKVQAPPAAPQVTAASVDDLTARVTALEAKASKPASDHAALARIDATEKSVSALRNDVASLRAQSERLASSVNSAASAPRDAWGAVDLSGINERIDKIERASRAQGDAIASDKAAESKVADDKPLRLVVAAALLDVAVRHGDPFAAELSAAKSLSQNADALKPLDGFATTGVPSPPVLCRELLALVPKLAPPPAQENETTGSGIVDRLKASAAKLVKVERTDAVGSDRGAVVARVTAAALRNDVADTRRELDSLSAADRAAAQGWLDKVKARDAALTASRQFAEQSMALLTKQAQ